jgi:hypothetical protein
MAARLGFDETTIRRLAARGHLHRLALTEPQIHARLYRGHVAYLLACAGEGGVDWTPGLMKPAISTSRSASTGPATRTPTPQLGSGGAQRGSERTPTQIGGATCDKQLSL